MIIGRNVTLSRGSNIFVLPEPLTVNNHTVDIRLNLIEQWDISPPWERLLYQGNEISITGRLYFSDNMFLSNRRLGRAISENKLVVISFPYFESAKTIEKIEIISDVELHCHEILLSKWRPK